MSEILEYLTSAIDSYLGGEIDLDAFRQAYWGSYHYVRDNAAGDLEANQLVDAIALPLSEFSRGYRSEDSLHRDLAIAVRPFVPERKGPNSEMLGSIRRYAFSGDDLSPVSGAMVGRLQEKQLEWRAG